MSEPMDYAWGMLKQQDSGGFNVVQQAAPGLQISLPMGGKDRKKGPGFFSRLRKPKSEHLATMQQQAQQAAQQKYPLRGQDPVQQTPPPLPGRGRSALGAALSGGKLLGQLGAAALSAADAQQSGSLMPTIGAAQSGYLQAGAALSPLDRFSQRTQDMYGARQNYETEQAMATQQVQQQKELDAEAKILEEEGAQEAEEAREARKRKVENEVDKLVERVTATPSSPEPLTAHEATADKRSGPVGGVEGVVENGGVPAPAGQATQGQPNPQEKAAEEAKKEQDKMLAQNKQSTSVHGTVPAPTPGVVDPTEAFLRDPKMFDEKGNLVTGDNQ